MKRLTLLRVLALLAGMLLLGTACAGIGEQALKTRGMAYLKVANDLNAAKDFMTPKMQDSLGGTARGGTGTVALPGIPLRLMSASSEQLAGITEADVSAQAMGKWGKVRVTLEGEVGARELDTIWVKVGGEWFLFAGTDGEIEAYGKPPVFVD